MLITSLAWNLKAWLALSLPEPCGPEKRQQARQKRGLLTMEFRTFVNSLMRVPAQVVRTGRQLVIRLLAWNEWQPVFFATGRAAATAIALLMSARRFRAAETRASH